MKTLMERWRYKCEHSGTEPFTSEARAALAKAIEIADPDLRKLDSGERCAGWLDWIIVHTLMGEAKALLNGQSSAANNPN
jgi:hypothetical protein